MTECGIEIFRRGSIGELHDVQVRLGLLGGRVEAIRVRGNWRLGASVSWKGHAIIMGKRPCAAGS
jgi:hypothetical protein